MHSALALCNHDIKAEDPGGITFLLDI